MSKQPSKHLFELVKILDANEKGYFKKYVSRHVIGEQNKYVDVFDGINKQKEYDEKKLLEDYDIVHTRLPKIKNYLYSLILKSLNSYHFESSIEIILKQQLCQVEILYNKGLYPHCRELLKKTKKHTTGHEKFRIQLELIQWEKKLMMKESYQRESQKELHKIFEEERLLLKTIDNLNEYWLRYSIVFTDYLQFGDFRDKEIKKRFSSIMNDRFMKSERNAQSYYAKIFFYSLHAIYYDLVKKDMKLCYETLKKLVHFMKSDTVKINDDPEKYVVTALNLLIAQARLKKFDEFFSLLKEVRQIPNEYNLKGSYGRNLQILIFVRSYVTELDVLTKTGDFEKAAVLVNQIKKGLELYRNEIDKLYETLFYYNISYLYFGLKNYSKALYWLNNILNSSPPEVGENFYCFAKIMNLIIHFEMGNMDLIEYEVKSTYRFLLKRKHLFKLEEILLQFIRKKIPKINSNNELIKELQKLKKEILASIEDLSEGILEHFDFISWLDSKIEKKNFADIVRYKAITS